MFFEGDLGVVLVSNRTPSERWYDGGQAIECIVFLGEGTKLWKSDIVLYTFRDIGRGIFLGTISGRKGEAKRPHCGDSLEITVGAPKTPRQSRGSGARG